MAFKFDHLAIGANTLEQGVSYINDKFGIKIPFGGVHKKMGTHNHLMQIGNGIFLEIIAINPQGTTPKVPQKRWFNLDDSVLQTELKFAPKIINWVVRTDNIKAQLIQTKANLGNIHHISRGNLNWQFAIREDGKMIENGLFPAVMQWQNNQSPASNMADFSIKLTKLKLTHPNTIKFNGLMTDYTPSKQVDLIITKGDYNIEAEFTLPNGNTITL